MTYRRPSLTPALCLAAPLLVLTLVASSARAETLRITCDNFIEQVFVDGAAQPLGPNANSWPSPDDYVLDLGPGAHTVAFRASDDASTIAGCMAVLFADDGTTPIAMTAPGVFRTVRVDPGAGWEAPGFDASSWPFASACANPGPWGTSLAWGRSLGAEMVWGPTQCDGPELGARRWFRWGVVVPECFDPAACNDANECTSESCASGFCARSVLPAGTPCSAGVCNGSIDAALCVACVDSSLAGPDAGCAGATPHCRTSGGGAPRCESCLDTTSGGLDQGCLAATPNCVASTGGAFACVACESDAQCADGDECTADRCAAGMCIASALPFGTACSAGLCDLRGDCAALAVVITTPADGSVSSDATPTYAGTATAGVTVTVIVDGVVVGMATAGADGSWSLTPSAPLAEGVHTAIASVMGGGASAMDDTTFTVDLSTRIAITSPAMGSTTSDSTPEIRGTGEPGAIVTVSVDGAAIGTAVVAADGTWVLEVPTALANGTHTAEAVARDTVGNTARAETTFEVDARTTVDIVAPASGSVTSDATPTISGTAAPGATVVVRVDGVEVGTVMAAADGTWSIDVTTSLADGSHMAEATATDGFGNTATDTSTFTVDTETRVEITAADGTSVAGTGEPGASIVVEIDGRMYGAVVVGADGTWSVTLDEPLAPGSHDATATATDAAGNTAIDTETIVVEEPSPDAGVPDAGTTDAGARDAGARLDAASSMQDAGVRDAASAPDAGMDAGPTPGGFAGGACGCRAEARRTSGWAVLALGLLLLTIRRRRR